jgi:hypothetical protein
MRPFLVVAHRTFRVGMKHDLLLPHDVVVWA